jgi:hypothetical protein
MRINKFVLMATVILTACAQAQAPAPKSIPDAEPDVTAQVAALLVQLGQGALPRAQLSDKAQTALTAPQLQQMGAALRPCAQPPTLELVARTTKGEDRNYLYRALCPNTPLLVEINFNKAAKIDRLVVRPELK